MAKDKRRNGRDKPDKGDKVTAKADAKNSKLLAKAELSRAKAAKRKWLVALIGILLIGYFVLSSGKVDLGGILEWVKGIGGGAN